METFKVRHADGRELDTNEAEFFRTFQPAGFVRVPGASTVAAEEAPAAPETAEAEGEGEQPAPKPRKGEKGE